MAFRVYAHSLWAQRLFLQTTSSRTRLCRIRQFSNSASVFSYHGKNYHDLRDLFIKTNSLGSDFAKGTNGPAIANPNTPIVKSEASEEASSEYEEILSNFTSDIKLDTAQSEEKDIPTGEQVYIEPYRPFLALWLRDNCQCSTCVNPVTRQRMVNTFAIPKDIEAKLVEGGPAGDIIIRWSDGHTGVYPPEWLSSHQTVVKVHRRKILEFKRNRIPRLPGHHPTIEYEDVMVSGLGLLHWVEQIMTWGYCLVENVPVDPDATKQLLERIAFIRHTHYGGFWDFTSDLTYNDTAYTSEALDPHTDNTYFTDPARLQLFHLLSHTEGRGGETVLVDGFAAAYDLLRIDPESVRALTRYSQPWHSSGNEDVCIQPYRYFPVFERDSQTAMLLRIRWNNYDRSAKIDWTYEAAESWYKAARSWNSIIRRGGTRTRLQLKPGTALIFDNWRMLHGRSAFTGKRRMCGGYINNDDFVSRYRLLKHGREKTLKDLGSRASRLGV